MIVGNGEALNCSGQCPNVDIHLHGRSFDVDFFVLPIQGTDVLGVHWLATLGNVLTNYQHLSMDFIWQQQHITSRGDSTSKAEPISFDQLKHLHTTNTIASFFQNLHLIPSSKSPTTPTPVPQSLQSLLLEFSEIFSEPDTLPPYRNIDHRIPLIPNTAPISSRPYRYPHSQKNEIDKQSLKCCIRVSFALVTAHFPYMCYLSKKKKMEHGAFV